MAATLAATVHVADDVGDPHVFVAGSVPPAWARARITNPHAWAEEREQELELEAAPTGAPDTGPGELVKEPTFDILPPPRSGAGSGRAAWVAYAERLGLIVDDTVSREQIIETVLTAEQR